MCDMTHDSFMRVRIERETSIARFRAQHATDITQNETSRVQHDSCVCDMTHDSFMRVRIREQRLELRALERNTPET